MSQAPTIGSKGKPEDGALSRRDRLQGFVQSLSEVAPLIAAHSADDVQNLPELLQESLERHLVLVTRIAEIWGIEAEEIRGSILARKLSLAVADLVAHQDAYNIPFDAFDSVLEQVASCIETFAEKQQGLRTLVTEEDLSTDSLVRVRLALLKPSLAMESRLVSLGAKPEYVEESIRWLHETALAYARDLAFNWDESAMYRDREALFTGSISMCADMALSSWEQTLIKQVPRREVVFDAAWWEKHSGEFVEAVFGLDMGYSSHETITTEWLIGKAEQMVREAADRIVFDCVPSMVSVCLQHIAGIEMIKIAVESWKQTAKAFLADIDAMSDEEYELYSGSEEASKPMDFSLFERAFWQAVDKWDGVFATFRVDLDAAYRSGLERLSTLWGMGSALNKVKSGQVNQS